MRHNLPLFRRLSSGPQILVLAALVSLALVAVACGSGGDATPVADDPGSLVVYSGRSESLVDPIIQQFADVTGIDVQVKYGGTASLAATILEEGGSSPADVFYAQDPGGLGAIESLLSALPASTLSGVPTWAQSPDGLWAGISGRARVLVYNTEAIAPANLPQDLWDLTDPKWKGKVGWAPTNGSFLTMVTGMRTIWGEDRTREWVEAMVENDTKIYPKNTPQVVAVAAGEIEIGLVNHYYLYQVRSEQGADISAENHHLPAGGPGSLVMISGAGILASSQNRENAERFADFLLSTVAQQFFAGQTFEYPLVDGVVTDPRLVPLDQIVRADIPLADLSDLDGTTALLRAAGALP